MPTWTDLRREDGDYYHHGGKRSNPLLLVNSKNILPFRIKKEVVGRINIIIRTWLVCVIFYHSVNSGNKVAKQGEYSTLLNESTASADPDTYRELNQQVHMYVEDKACDWVIVTKSLTLGNRNE